MATNVQPSVDPADAKVERERVRAEIDSLRQELLRLVNDAVDRFVETSA